MASQRITTSSPSIGIKTSTDSSAFFLENHFYFHELLAWRGAKGEGRSTFIKTIRTINIRTTSHQIYKAIIKIHLGIYAGERHAIIGGVIKITIEIGRPILS